MESRANSLRAYAERLQEMAEDRPDIADIIDGLNEFAEQWEAELAQQSLLVEPKSIGFNDFINELKAAGWKDTADAQWDGASRLHTKWFTKPAEDAAGILIRPQVKVE